MEKTSSYMWEWYYYHVWEKIYLGVAKNVTKRNRRAKVTPGRKWSKGHQRSPEFKKVKFWTLFKIAKLYIKITLFPNFFRKKFWPAATRGQIRSKIIEIGQKKKDFRLLRKEIKIDVKKLSKSNERYWRFIVFSKISLIFHDNKIQIF